ncbi:MAG: YlxR family protein [Candidatus Gastranaerophilaceae bacterium]
MTKEVLRKCIGCFESKNREEMIKITREYKTKEIFINPNSKIFGRSVYLCYNKTCIENSLKKNKLAKFLKANLSEEFKETLRTIHKE